MAVRKRTEKQGAGNGEQGIGNRGQGIEKARGRKNLHPDSEVVGMEGRPPGDIAVGCNWVGCSKRVGVTA